jgi:hypothetical protein
MELILGFSLVINLLFAGMFLLGHRLNKRKEQEVEKEIERAVEKFSKQYYDLFKDWMTHA